MITIFLNIGGIAFERRETAGGAELFQLWLGIV
jgi:hypothetical protein